MAFKKQSIYCEGWIDLKRPEINQQYIRYYGKIKDRGLHLFRSPTSINAQMEEEFTLSSVDSVTKQQRRGSNLDDVPTICIQYKPGNKVSELRIKTQNRDENSKWFRRLYAICLLKEPSDIKTLLPGQAQELRDIIKRFNREIENANYVDMTPAPTSRKSSVPHFFPPNFHSNPVNIAGTLNMGKQQSNPILSPSPKSPHVTHRVNDKAHGYQQLSTSQSETGIAAATSNHKWYFSQELSREDAEHLLRENQEFGNMILRKRLPSVTNDPWTYAVSIRIDDKETPDYKHYKIRKSSFNGSMAYLIHLNNESHPTLQTLEDVVTYFAQRNPGAYRPMTDIRHLPQHTYEESLPPGNANSRIERKNAYENDIVDTDGVAENGGYMNLTGNMRPSTLHNSNPSTGGRGRLPRQISVPIIQSHHPLTGKSLFHNR